MSTTTGSWLVVWWIETEKIISLVANEQPREDARLRDGGLIEPCAIVSGKEKISNACNRVM